MLDEGTNALHDVKTILTTVPYFPNDQTQNAGGKTGGFSARGGVNTKLRLLEIESVHTRGTLFAR